MDEQGTHARRTALIREMVRRDLRRYRWWARYWSIVLLFGWAVWVVFLEPFESSVSYLTFSHFGENATGVVVGGLALVSFFTTFPRRHHRWYLVVGMIVQAAILAGIAATFAHSNLTSTGVWVYSVLCLASIVGALDLAMLPQVPPGEQYG